MRALRRELSAVWIDTPAELPPLGQPVSRRRQFGNARAASRLIDELGHEVASLRGHEPPAEWRIRVQAHIQQFGQERFGWPEGYRQLPFGPAFYESTLDFARDARESHPAISPDELGQALRNVWIGNSLQMMLGQPPVAHPALFAYSLLYPATDNWLDDPEVSDARKRRFNERLTRRLSGQAVSPDDEREWGVYRLIQRIETACPRAHHPDLYAALLAIQRGQVRSLEQHIPRGAAKLSDRELLAISVEKGGSSVLVDLHLVAGDVAADDEMFAFGYGVFLQLLDDLQDVESDLAIGHETLFTRAARRGTLDDHAARLTRFIDAVLETYAGDTSGWSEAYLDLIRRNSRTLLVSCVAEMPGRFSRRFRRDLGARWPVSLRAHRRLQRQAMTWWTRFAPAASAGPGPTIH